MISFSTHTKVNLIKIVKNKSYIVDFGKAGWINKARQQPDRVKDVINKIRSSGFLDTFRAIKNKLIYA